MITSSITVLWHWCQPIPPLVQLWWLQNGMLDEPLWNLRITGMKQYDTIWGYMRHNVSYIYIYIYTIIICKWLLAIIDKVFVAGFSSVWFLSTFYPAIIAWWRGSWYSVFAMAMVYNKEISLRLLTCTVGHLCGSLLQSYRLASWTQHEQVTIWTRHPFFTKGVHVLLQHSQRGLDDLLFEGHLGNHFDYLGEMTCVLRLNPIIVVGPGDSRVVSGCFTSTFAGTRSCRYSTILSVPAVSAQECRKNLLAQCICSNLHDICLACACPWGVLIQGGNIGKETTYNGSWTTSPLEWHHVFFLV